MCVRDVVFLRSCTFIECTLRQKTLHGKKQTEHFRQRQALKRRVWTASLRLHIKPIVLRDHVGLQADQFKRAGQSTARLLSVSLDALCKQHGHKWKTISSSVCLVFFFAVFFHKCTKLHFQHLYTKWVRCIGEKRWRSLWLAQSSTNSTDSMSGKTDSAERQVSTSIEKKIKSHWTVEPFTSILLNIYICEGHDPRSLFQRQTFVNLSFISKYCLMTDMFILVK